MPSLRRPAAVGAVAAALVTSYALGVATPRGDGGAPAPSATSVLDSAARVIAERAAEPTGSDALERAAVQGMLDTLGDRWASYYPPSDYASYADALDGRFTGVGLWLRAGAGGELVVGSVTGGSPAQKAGVRTGDVVTAVDGRAMASVPDAAAALRGPAGVDVRVTLRRAGAELVISLTREEFRTESVSSGRTGAGSLLVRVESFSRGVGREVRNAVGGLGAAASRGMVLDLRGNPGGLLDEAVEVASAFLDGGVVVSYDRRGAGTRTLEAVGTADASTPLVVLVDSGTASAAEVVAGALQDRGRAVVVGSRTFGKGSVQEAEVLPDGSVLELTVGHYRTPEGRDLDGAGIAPDIEVAAGAGPEVAERRAADVLLGLRAALTEPPPR